MRRRDLILGGTLALAASNNASAHSWTIFSPAGWERLAGAHDRIKQRLSEPDRLLLAQLSKRLAAALPKGLFPDDARRALRRAAPDLTADEIEALAYYASLEIMESLPSPPVDTQMSFNLQYLELQSSMQNENRSYTAVSNIMKTKHDTVKNTISNIH